MNSGLTLDPASLKELQRKISQYKKDSGKDAVETLNHAGLQLALRALWNTKSADKQDIESLREVYAVTVFGKKRRLKKAKELRRATTRGLVVYISKLRRDGNDPKGLSTEQLMTGAIRMVNRRMSSVSFIKSGWIAAIKRLSNALGKGTPSLPRKRAGKGSARPAVQSENPFAEIVNRSRSDTAKGSDAALLRYGGQGLTSAIPVATADLAAYGEKKLTQRAAEFNK